MFLFAVAWGEGHPLSLLLLFVFCVWMTTWALFRGRTDQKTSQYADDMLLYIVNQEHLYWTPFHIEGTYLDINRWLFKFSIKRLSHLLLKLYFEWYFFSPACAGYSCKHVLRSLLFSVISCQFILFLFIPPHSPSLLAWSIRHLSLCFGGGRDRRNDGRFSALVQNIIEVDLTFVFARIPL